MALDMTSFAPALKAIYTNDRIENETYKDNPLLAIMPKMEKFGGKNLPIPLIYGNGAGRSATFSDAQGNKTNTKLKDFVLTRDQDYAVASIDNETLDASQGDSYAFMEAATTEIDSALRRLTRSLAIAMYRNGSGSIGQCNASTTGTSLQLKNADDVTNFEVDDELVFSTADGGGTVKAGSVTVTAVNRDTGELTVDALSAIDSGAGVAANDYIFIEGDYDQKIKGLQAWIPNSAPGATAFFSVDRTSDVTRLGGIRYDGSALPIEEALVGAISRSAREGAKPDYCFMNYSKWDELVKALGSKVQYIDEVVKAGEAFVSFKGVMIHGPRGPVKVIPDQNCPSDRAFLLQMDTWKLYSLGKAVRIQDSDGLKMLRETSADAVEVRCVTYAQVGCRAPGYNVNIKLD